MNPFGILSDVTLVQFPFEYRIVYVFDPLKDKQAVTIPGSLKIKKSAIFQEMNKLTFDVILAGVSKGLTPKKTQNPKHS